MSTTCTHLFAHRRFWWLRSTSNRWQCVNCGLITRHIGIEERIAEVFIHEHITLAVTGYNTVGKQS